MNTNTLISLIVIFALIGVGGFFLLNRDGSENLPPEETATTETPTENGTTQTPPPAGTGGQMAEPQATVITYSDTGFSPNSITIRRGDAVSFVNKSAQQMWVGADPHPVHTSYDGTSRTEHCPSTFSFDQCAAGTSYEFTFTKKGTWSYHNHLRPQDLGTIIV